MAVLGTTKNGAVMTRAAVDQVAADQVAEDPLGAVLQPVPRQVLAVTVWNCSKIFILKKIKQKITEGRSVNFHAGGRSCKNNRL